MNKLPISAFIITYNEETNIRQCINSLSFCNEIIIVDSLSTDNTVSIAKELGAKVYSQSFLGYRDQKQLALSKCSNEWVLSLDADERVSNQLQEFCLSYNFTDSEFNGFEFPRLHWFNGQWLKHGGLYPDYKLRLFRKDKGLFIGENIHEVVSVEGKSKKITYPILHYAWRDFHHFITSQTSYAEKVAQARINQKNHIRPFEFVYKPIYTFIHRYFIRGGILDGWWGLIFALSFAYLSGYKSFRIWENNKLNLSHHTKYQQIRQNPLIKILLYPISWIYGCIVYLKNLFTRFCSTPYTCNYPVISIGNLSCGGTGKTIVTSEVAQYLRLVYKFNTHILLRGYKAKQKITEPILVQANMDASKVGDEALMLAHKGHPSVLVCPNRRKSIQYILDQDTEKNCFILDDGFQHQSVHRDINICLIDCSDTLNTLLPIGNLREPLSELKRATHIILTRSKLIPHQTNKTLKYISKHFPNKPTYYLEEELLITNTQNQLESSTQTFFVVCGIGNPIQYIRSLKNNDISIKHHLIFPDHHDYTDKDLHDIYLQFIQSEANFILMTPKDWIKISSLSNKSHQNLAKSVRLSHSNINKACLKNIVDEIILPLFA